MTFKELYLSGQVPFEEIDRYISRWNRSDDERTLAKYLGLNADEEDVWIDDSDEALKEMLDARERVAGTPVTLGKTDIIVNKNGFGALPIQRISFDDAKVLLRKAYDAGVRFFDTARFYTDSEEKIGYALSGRPGWALHRGPGPGQGSGYYPTPQFHKASPKHPGGFRHTFCGGTQPSAPNQLPLLCKACSIPSLPYSTCDFCCQRF